MITYEVQINLASQVATPIIQAVQGDTGRSFSFVLSDYTIPDGATATYYVAKPSGEAVYNSATISGNSVICDMTAQSLAETGENPMQIRILSGDEVVTSFEVILMVRKFYGEDAIESSTEMNIFDQAVEAAAEQFQTDAEAIVAEVVESIPDDYTALSAEVDELNERIGQIEAGGVSSSVREALYTLLSNAAYTTTGLTDEIAVIQAWAEATTSITLNQSTVSISGATTAQLTATTVPSGGSVSWASSDSTIASVDSTGLVTGVNNGTATITATSGTLSATCTATVSGFVSLTGISAVYTQSGTVYDTDDLSDLVSDLVVTATYSDSTTAIISSDDYTLSGTLAEGTSTVTVSYGGCTDTFSVTVSVRMPINDAYLLYDARDVTSGATTWNPRIGSIAMSLTGATCDGTKVSFDGIDDYGTLASVTSVTGSVQTIQMCIALTDLTKISVALIHTDNRGATFANLRPHESLFRIAVPLQPSGSTVSFSNTFDSDYHLYTVIFNKTTSTSVTLTVYVDDTLIGTDTVGTESNSSINAFPLQISAPAYSNFLSGNVRSFMIYDKELSSAEIARVVAYEQSIIG